MSRKKRRDAPEWQWEQALLDDYYDYRWRQALDPLYEQFQRWRAGELSHADIDEAIHKTHKQTREVYGLFGFQRDYLVKIIQLDTDWFDTWVKNHPPPPGVTLTPRLE